MNWYQKLKEENQENFVNSKVVKSAKKNDPYKICRVVQDEIQPLESMKGKFVRAVSPNQALMFFYKKYPSLGEVGWELVAVIDEKQLAMDKLEEREEAQRKDDARRTEWSRKKFEAMQDSGEAGDEYWNR
jgi:hypothetical protein